MLRPLSLTALIVDDDDVHSRLCRDSLENIDMALRAYGENEAAIKAIDDISTLQLPLHILITDIERPNGPLGLSFIEHVRSASYAKIVGGGLRLRYLPLIVISNAARLYREQVSRIDGAIQVYEKPMWEERLVEVIVDALSAYRSKILGELQHLGIAVVFKEGLYQVLPAYGAQKPELIETDRFVGLASALSSSYTALCLLQDKGAIARLYLYQFERLLNSPKVTERELQAFLQQHPEFILRGEFDSYWAQPQLRDADSTKVICPDFVLQPLGLRSTSWNWQLVDLKSPRVPLLANSQFHRDLSRHVSRVVTQLKDYGEFFSNPRNGDIIRQRFGGVIPQPKLVALIGRLPDNDARERYTTLRTRLTDVCLTTYDEILEFRRARVDQIESALSR